MLRSCGRSIVDWSKEYRGGHGDTKEQMGGQLGLPDPVRLQIASNVLKC